VYQKLKDVDPAITFDSFPVFSLGSEFVFNHLLGMVPLRIFPPLFSLLESEDVLPFFGGSSSCEVLCMEAALKLFFFLGGSPIMFCFDFQLCTP